MWDKATYDEFVEVLNNNDAMKIATWLSRIPNEPCGNPSILPHLESLLEDKRITVLRTPSAYGELRWNAALALVMERQIQNVGEPVVVLKNTFEPMAVPDILVLIADSSFTLPAGTEWPNKLAGIRDSGNLALHNYEIRFGQEARKL